MILGTMSFFLELQSQNQQKQWAGQMSKWKVLGVRLGQKCLQMQAARAPYLM